MLHIVDQQNSYVQHLVNLAARQQVSISEDVKNHQGAVLIRKGSILDKELALKISHHNLEQPLENCVQLNAGINSERLLNYIKKMLIDNSSFSSFKHDCELTLLLEQACKYYQKFPLLMQKMTVLNTQMPNLFQQALMCSYFSMAIAHEMELSPIECKWVFIAGLIHNVGILHLDESVLANKGEYTSQQWRTLQSHPLLAHKILTNIENLPKCISTAVLEHHECFDGSGYPFNKSGAQLGIMGQIVGISDACIAVYKRELAHKKLGFDALGSVLQLNPSMYRATVYSATLALINNSVCTQKRVYQDSDMPQVINRLMIDNQSIQHDYRVIFTVLKSIAPYAPKNKKNAMLKMASNRVEQFFDKSGILDKEHNQWLIISCGAHQQEDYQAIEAFELIYSEVKWQLKQLIKLLCWLWDKKQFKHPKLQEMVQKGLDQIKRHHQQETYGLI